MEQIANKNRRARRTHEEIKQLLEEFKKGDEKISNFCELHRISNTTFHQWQSRYNIEAPNNVTSTSFTKLKIRTPELQHSSLLFAEVHGIKFYQPVAAYYLKELAGL